MKNNNKIDEIRDLLHVDSVSKHYNFTAPEGRKNISSPLRRGDDKTPSFSISSDGKLWYCFSSGVGGDWIKFIGLMEGLNERSDFLKIMEVAGRIVGVDYDSSDSVKIKTPKKNEFFAQWDALLENKKKHSMAARMKYLQEKAVDMEETECEWGVAKDGEGWQVAIPMRDLSKEICGFQRANKMVMRGGGHGYFMDFEYIDKTEPVFIVEGMSDYLSMMSHGFKNVIGISTANLDITGIRSLVESSTKPVYIILDYDYYGFPPVGSKAGMKKAIDISKELGGIDHEVHFIDTEHKTDINDLHKAGVLKKKSFIKKIEDEQPSNITTLNAIANGSDKDKSDADHAKDFLTKNKISYAGDKWWVFNDPIWKRASDQEVYLLIQQYLERNVGGRHTQKKIMQIAFYLKLNCVENTLGLERSLKRDSDYYRENKDYIYVKNGRYNFNTNEIVPYEPSDYIISTIDVSVEPDSDFDCPNFTKFLDDIFSPDEDKEDKKLFLQEWIGYIMYPYNTFQKMLFILGSGANGKGTLLSTIERIIGRCNVKNMEVSELDDNRFSKAELLGCYANLCTDAEKLSNLASPTLKKITGGDTLTAERKYESPFVFQPFAKMIFASNNEPHATDIDNWLLRRLHMIKFNNVFADQHRSGDVDILSKLIKEKDAIFMWSMEGLKRLMNNKKFTIPKSVDSITSKFIVKCDIVKEYYKTNLSKMLNEFDTIRPLSHVYSDFRDYSKNEMGISDRYIVSRQRFIERLTRIKSITIDGQSVIWKKV